MSGKSRREHAWERREMHINLKGKDRSEDLRVIGRIIVRWILEKQEG
jgi:hypothetical protein